MRESLVNQGCVFQIAYYVTASLIWSSSKSVIKDLSLCGLAVMTFGHASYCSPCRDVLICLVPSSGIWRKKRT